MISTLFLSLALTGASPADLAAVGIVVSSRPERSVAILRSGGRTRMGTIGDAAFGGRITAITAERVIVLFPDGPRELSLGAAVGANVAPLRTVAPTPAALAGERSLERREVERRLGEEIPRILAETTLLPVTSAGRVAGLTITRMPPGTILTEAGLQSGDILTEVNGVPIDSMATLIALYPRLQGESVLRAQVLRNGQPLTLSLVLR